MYDFSRIIEKTKAQASNGLITEDQARRDIRIYEFLKACERTDIDRLKHAIELIELEESGALDVIKKGA